MKFLSQHLSMSFYDTILIKYYFSLSLLESKFLQHLSQVLTREIPSSVHNDPRQLGFEGEQRILIPENCDGINQASKYVPFKFFIGTGNRCPHRLY